jgi:hypothetical protein
MANHAVDSDPICLLELFDSRLRFPAMNRSCKKTARFDLAGICLRRVNFGEVFEC